MNEIDKAIHEIQTLISNRTLTISQLAKQAKVPRSTIANIRSNVWNPTGDVLSKLIDVAAIHRDKGSTYDNRREQPIAVPLTRQRIELPDCAILNDVLGIWCNHKGILSLEAQNKLNELGMQSRQSLAELRSDGRLYFRMFGLCVWGAKFVGKPVVDQPDEAFAVFAEARLRRTLFLNEPSADHCRAWIQTAIGNYLIPYRAMLTPWTAPGDRDPSLVLSVTLLDESPYKAALGRQRR